MSKGNLLSIVTHDSVWKKNRNVTCVCWYSCSPRNQGVVNLSVILGLEPPRRDFRLKSLIHVFSSVQLQVFVGQTPGISLIFIEFHFFEKKKKKNLVSRG